MAAEQVQVAPEGIELEPDIDEPWLPGIAKPAVAIPLALAATAVAAIVLAANLERGVVTALVCAALAAALCVLTVTDVQVMRLPDPIVLPLYAALSLAVVGTGLLGEHGWDAVLRAFACMAGAYAVLWCIAVATGNLGWGDVKLGGLIALVAGMEGWVAGGLAALILPVVLSTFVAFPMLMMGRGKMSIAFGPFMALGALLVLAFPGVAASIAGFPPS